MKGITQRELIKKHLEEHENGITSMEAFSKYGATRLSGIIYDLKHRQNMNIKTSIESVDTRYGKTCIARYKLAEGQHHE